MRLGFQTATFRLMWRLTAQCRGDNDIPTADALPATLREYLEVWCADLLGHLTAGQRASVISTVHCTYAGGPWPPRLQVQRLAEIAACVITGDAYVGEIIARYGHPIRDVVEMLYSKDPDVRDNAIVMLGRHPNTSELVPKVSAAHRAGALTDAEFRGATNSPHGSGDWCCCGAFCADRGPKSITGHARPSKGKQARNSRKHRRHSGVPK